MWESEGVGYSLLEMKDQELGREPAMYCWWIVKQNGQIFVFAGWLGGPSVAG